MDFVAKLPPKVSRRIFNFLDIETLVGTERVSKQWKQLVRETMEADSRPIWLYVMFRKGRAGGHDKPTVNISTDGPIFWEKKMVYIYCCSCHFHDKHEMALLGLFERLAHRVERLCLVDSPVNYPFLTDCFFNVIINKFARLQFLYMRELDLENLNFPTVQEMAQKKNLKKVIVHMCRKADTLQDFNLLPQLMVVKGEIQGLKVLVGEMPENELPAYFEAKQKAQNAQVEENK